MYETGHSSSGKEVLAALHRLEAVLLAHEQDLEETGPGAEPASLWALRHHMALMQDEVLRLRQLLAA